MNKHPKSEDILKVIGVFEKVLPMAKIDNHLDMMQGSVSGGFSVCGTVHCHGGWYLIGKLGKPNKYTNFFDGIKEMSKDLGLDNGSYMAGFSGISDWAIENPNLWGNSNGRGVFSDRIAFISSDRPNGAQNLQHIIAHWKEVYERVKAMENSQSQTPEPQPEVHPTKTKEVIRYVSVSASLKKQIPELINN